MRRNTRLVACCAAGAALIGLMAAPRVLASGLPAATAPSSPIDCIGPAGNPAPGTPAWTERDEVNQFCATHRQAGGLGLNDGTTAPTNPHTVATPTFHQSK